MIQCDKCATENGTKIEEPKNSADKGPIPGGVAYEYKEVKPTAGIVVELTDGAEVASEEVGPKVNAPASSPQKAKGNDDDSMKSCKACCYVL